MSNIKSMTDKSNNAMLTSPENVLKDALKEVAKTLFLTEMEIYKCVN